MTLGTTRQAGRLPALDADDAFIALLIAARDASDTCHRRRQRGHITSSGRRDAFDIAQANQSEEESSG
jgi:hypothetical protein